MPRIGISWGVKRSKQEADEADLKSEKKNTKIELNLHLELSRQIERNSEP
jgi:hypothetical protein